MNMGERERQSTESLTENTVVVTRSGSPLRKKTSFPAAYSSLRLRKASRIGCKSWCGVCETQEPLAMADGGRARGGGADEQKNGSAMDRQI